MDQGIPSYCVITVQSMENMIVVILEANTCSKLKVNCKYAGANVTFFKMLSVLEQVLFIV